MRSAVRYFVAMFVICIFVVGAGSVSAGKVPKNVKQGIKQKMKSVGIIYTRIELPCKYGRHTWGTYKKPLVEVTPAGTNTEGATGLESGYWHAEGAYWGVGTNFPVKFDEMEIDDGGIEIELKGALHADGINTVVLFKEISTMQDFEKAFDHVFSMVPLQDEHPDWSLEIRDAVGDRRLVEGMTKRQAYCVVGAPLRFEEKEADGVKTEVWFLRQDRGTKVGYWGGRTGKTGLPSQITFIDGKLTSIGSASGSGSTNVNLDD